MGPDPKLMPRRMRSGALAASFVALFQVLFEKLKTYRLGGILHFSPCQTGLIARRDMAILESEKMQPAIVKKSTHLRVTVQNDNDCFFRGFDHY